MMKITRSGLPFYMESDTVMTRLWRSPCPRSGTTAERLTGAGTALVLVWSGALAS